MDHTSLVLSKGVEELHGERVLISHVLGEEERAEVSQHDATKIACALRMGEACRMRDFGV